MMIDPQLRIDCYPGVYEPAEDSYLLLSALQACREDRVLEIGCGTGIIALHCAKIGAYVTASDINPKAVDCARTNADRNRLNLRVVESDLLEKIEGSYNLIVFNPPYLPENGINDIQWTGGQSGIEIIVRFLEQSKGHLARDGRIIIIGSSLCNLEKFKKAAKKLGYESKILKKEELFFESLFVYELRLVEK